MAHPTYEKSNVRGYGFSIRVTIPLWQVALLCLAWPATSFFLYRRREGRGFEVEGVKEDAPEG